MARPKNHDFEIKLGCYQDVCNTSSNKAYLKSQLNLEKNWMYQPSMNIIPRARYIQSKPPHKFMKIKSRAPGRQPSLGLNTSASCILLPEHSPKSSSPVPVAMNLVSRPPPNLGSKQNLKWDSLNRCQQETSND